MVQLLDEDVQRKEVFGWKGVHLFHYFGSSCSQKTRIVLNLKGVEWTSHLVDLSKVENFTPDYLGINPRGLVPTLVIDGEVHIESNDIISLLDERFPVPKLIPAGREHEIYDRLRMEDDLHLDIRTITFRFTQNRGKAPRSAESLSTYRHAGSGTVQGKPDPEKDVQIRFWEMAASESGITDDAVRASAGRLRAALAEIDAELAGSPNILGDDLTLLDIAWYIYVNRLTMCTYPMERLHPYVWRWFRGLHARPEFSGEVTLPEPAMVKIRENQARLAAAGASLSEVAAL
jgi:glutathione S-transferase